ncbi:translation elongation factor 2 (EF-2/EF-G) [Cnuella takakiae]|uniref:Elongation factor G n=1 Tax=Cnuella takakiae TaxID=1302690 RepID=A0A1M4VMZ6_9BACT|nr:elongation factor G [Cnuella takakiae]OLY92551.1 elongation factor G [Cnuella takakiae]SHE70233.1 translation elongation factor 2 (EF-2/EF-G) [Cnuella takakiae]
MPEFDTAHVKNIVLLGHAGSGKTTLSECMLYEAGLISRRGSVEEQNTTADYHPLEQERGNSLFSKLLHTRWRGYKINILDTPGYNDFVGEVLAALRVADTGVMLLNASQGVEVGSDIIWEYTEQFKTPMIFAINKLDEDSADYDRTLQEAKEHFGSKICVVQYPRQVGAGFHEIIDVLRMTRYKFKDTGGKPEKLPIPEEEQEKAARLHQELVEAVAANDETLMEHYFDKGELEEDELKEGMKKAMINHELFPLFCLSAQRNMGSGRLMGFIDNVCPSANEMPPQQTTSGEPLPCTADGPPCIFVYKTISEQHVGDLSFFKVFSGTIKSGMELVNESNNVVEKFNQLFLMEGNKRTPVNELVAGDIGATLKLRNTHVNNTLHARGRNINLAPIVFPAPNMTVSIEPANKGDEEKLAQALHQLREEDPTLLVEVSSELKQTLLHCQGDAHLSVARWKMEHNQRVAVKFGKARIPYRETIRKMAEASYRHKKQSGGAGQFGEVHLRIEPWYEGMPEPHGLTVRGREIFELDWGGKLVYYNCIVGGAIDNRFMPSILKGVMEKMHEGPLTGSYVRDVRVCVFDGKMHPVDSNDISFKIAGIMAFKQAFTLADPQLLEPICRVAVLCPDDLTGAVMGELQTRRGVMEGMDAEGAFQKIVAQVPQAELHDFSSALRSITQGRAKFNMQVSGYAPVSFDLQRKLTDAYNSHMTEALA